VYYYHFAHLIYIVQCIIFILDKPLPAMAILTAKDKDTCSYSGFFGILISATCLIQNFIFFRPHWITFLLIAVYLFSITAFSLLIAQIPVAPLLLLINAILLGLGTLLLILSIVVSVIVILLFIYAVVIVSVVNAEGFPEKFRQKAIAARAEKELWKDKI
jgi:Na+-transporting methylmalonyl-CoA/oxaloacetate decarboxylase gamma subunit